MLETVEAAPNANEVYAGEQSLRDLLPALRRLDTLLEWAVTAAHAAYGPDAADDPFRGLHISEQEVARLLAHMPGEATSQLHGAAGAEPLPDPATAGSRLAWLAQAFSLSRFDVDIIVIALAPELDRRYERLYAYLQDHVSRRRPGVDLALNLLCQDAAAKLECRTHFDPDAPLIRHGIIHLLPEPDHDHPSLLAHSLKLDEQIVRFLLHQDSLDARLAPYCQLNDSDTCLDDLPLNVEMKQALPVLLVQAREARRPVRLHFHGPNGVGKRRTAEALAREVGAPLLAVDLLQALNTATDFKQTLQLVFHAAWFQNAVVYLDSLDVLRGAERAVQYRCLLEVLATDRGCAILAGTQAWIPAGRAPPGVMTVPFPVPNFEQRRACWRSALAAEDITVAADELDPLTGRFRLTRSQIEEAVILALNQARWRAAAQSSAELPSASNAQPTVHDLFAAARTQSGHDLMALAQKIDPIYTWDDIVLLEETLAHLREICQRVAHRQRVLGEWGFDRKLSLGKGINALFAGPSGTGKTMAAEIIANELQLDLYKIDLSGVVSKYIGETEKNLDRIFTAAENANGILFFDEADALFGKRSEVRDSHDRYANIEISYLLQKLEEYDGLAILATNLRQNLDDAFVRRMAFTIHFPFPDESSRQRIWVGIWPNETPLAGDVDLDALARQFKLPGGNIKNIALAAAFLAAADGGPITSAHLLQATRREYQKLGKVLSEAELNGARRKPATDDEW